MRWGHARGRRAGRSGRGVEKQGYAGKAARNDVETDGWGDNEQKGTVLYVGAWCRFRQRDRVYHRQDLPPRTCFIRRICSPFTTVTL